MKREIQVNREKAAVSGAVPSNPGLCPLSELPKIKVVTDGPFGTAFTRLERLITSAPILLSPQKEYVFELKGEELHISPARGVLGTVEVGGDDVIHLMKVEKGSGDETRYTFQAEERIFAVVTHDGAPRKKSASTSRTTSPWRSSSSSESSRGRSGER